jgi:hypothetical protein
MSEHASDARYEDRYCAFVDILGFRQLIDGLTRDAGQFDALKNLLARVHGAGVSSGRNASDFRAQSISDAVAISTLPTEQGLADVFESLRALAVDLLVEDYFVRGAVVRAPLYHDDGMVFGEALVRAYSFESEIARFPRIIVAREVRDDIASFPARRDRSASPVRAECLRQSSDGPMYLDVLQPIVSLFKKEDHAFEKLSRDEELTRRLYSGIRDKIQQRYEESMDSPRHFEKVQWFARYWNKEIPRNRLMSIRVAE